MRKMFHSTPYFVLSLAYVFESMHVNSIVVTSLMSVSYLVIAFFYATHD